jgi:hypothetical protein
MSPASNAPRPPELTYLATFRIKVGSIHQVTPPGEATRRIIPILGGTLEGPELTAEILPYGADFQTQRSPGGTELDARYMAATNLAVRAGSPEDIAALASGNKVPAERIYFRCSPRISTDAPRLAHLNDKVLIGSGRREPDAVIIDVWTVL